MTGLQLDESLCTVTDNGFLRWLKGKLPRYSRYLMSYYVYGNGRTCIGVWQNRKSGLVKEIFSYATLDEIPQNVVGYISWWLGEGRRDSNIRSRSKWKSECRQRKLSQADRGEEFRDRRKFSTSRLNIHKRSNPNLWFMEG
jgi:hypothetical protein